jgi:hypothetical protein
MAESSLGKIDRESRRTKENSQLTNNSELIDNFLGGGIEGLCDRLKLRVCRRVVRHSDLGIFKGERTRV